MPSHPLGEKPFPHIGSKPPLMQLHSISMKLPRLACHTSLDATHLFFTQAQMSFSQITGYNLMGKTFHGILQTILIQIFSETTAVAAPGHRVLKY